MDHDKRACDRGLDATEQRASQSTGHELQRASGGDKDAQNAHETAAPPPTTPTAGCSAPRERTTRTRREQTGAAHQDACFVRSFVRSLVVARGKCDRSTGQRQSSSSGGDRKAIHFRPGDVCHACASDAPRRVGDENRGGYNRSHRWPSPAIVAPVGLLHRTVG